MSLVIYAGLSFTTVATHRLRLKLITYVVLAAVFVVGLFAAAQSVPQIAEVMGTRAALEQPYDVGPNGRFGGQIKAVGLILTHPLGIGALEFARVYDNEDAHEVYLSMFLNAGWIGGTLYPPWCCSRLVLVCAKSCATAAAKGSAWCWSPPLLEWRSKAW